MLNLTEELDKIAISISKFIEKDPFPATIRPLALAESVLDYPERGGKRIRPALLLWTCAMLGGDTRMAISAAAAVEIYHNWTLVHDDIIDRDELRRGKPTSHISLKHYAENAFPGKSQEDAAAFGTAFAILTGDAQQAWAINALCKLADYGAAPELVLRLVHAMQTELNRNLISGEAQDIEFEYLEPADVRKDDVLRMIDGKTGALIEFSVQAGAAIAKGRYEPYSEIYMKLSKFSRDFARAFQLQDDMIGVFSDVTKLGKPICADFKEAKPTLLYLEAIDRLDDNGRQELNSMLRLPVYGKEEISKIRAILTDCGAKQTITDMNRQYTESAVSILKSFPDNDWRALLVEFVEQLLSRLN